MLILDKGALPLINLYNNNGTMEFKIVLTKISQSFDDQKMFADVITPIIPNNIFRFHTLYIPVPASNYRDIPLPLKFQR